VSQSEVLGAVLIAGFLLFLAMNQRLKAYWSILLGGTPSGGGTPATAAPGASSTAPPSAGSVLGGAVTDALKNFGNPFGGVTSNPIIRGLIGLPPLTAPATTAPAPADTTAPATTTPPATFDQRFPSSDAFSSVLGGY
jgi:hypothetical protein